ncbi:SIR2 family NAD-dependent protein deacylase [Schaalia vaccimaxillae]|uniref:SIR2 family NAD-dependent protein deacylase n=1 Tax=Schaalia vaccimaxillae TaxID=183916 RepID=UPI0003B71C23|nr:hypothetical protein [Schaalia vaccimaxillae]
MREKDCSASLGDLVDELEAADAVVVGAGAGLSTAAGLTYSGERFERLFPDFIGKYRLRDMYSAGFFPFPSPQERWAYWSRHIWCNRYIQPPEDTYAKLLRLVDGKDYFVLTTNVDHQFQSAGFAKERLFYTQGDYGLWQCSEPCRLRTYHNYDSVRRMIEAQGVQISAGGDVTVPDGGVLMEVPEELVPRCPVCSGPMSMNLRTDSTFVEDAGWHEAAARYRRFTEAHRGGRVIYMELGVGMNTPGIIKYPFWRAVYANPEASYVCANLGDAYAPAKIGERSILIDGDLNVVLDEVLALAGKEH